MNKKQYLNKLKALTKRIPNEFEKEIFAYLCYNYQQHITQGTSKFVEKEDIIRHLLDIGLMKMAKDKVSGLDKLPTDRTVRSAVHKLIRNGLPILSSSRHRGFYICDNKAEVEQPLAENKKRALSILSKQKGYEKMAMFVSGQLDITDINLSKNYITATEISCNE